MLRTIVLLLGVVAVVVAAAATAHAAIVTREHGIDFVTIGDPGNRAATSQEAPGFFPPFWNPVGIQVGRVDYEYRLSRTEITVGQYLEFVRAFGQYWQGNPASTALTGTWIWPQSGGGFAATPGSERLAANMSWHNAARFCNWLHNNKVTEPWAFENGAYDTSTFGTGYEQPTRHPDARFWIPSLDEHVKGMNYDPDRYGSGAEGYWTFPNSSEVAPISGYPGMGGQTSAGLPYSWGVEGWVPVGSYPHVQSPWGLLDGSGGESEWTELKGDPQSHRAFRGSRAFVQFFENWDRIDGLSAAPSSSAFGGLRLATAIPAPATSGILSVGAAFLLKRRNR